MLLKIYNELSLICSIIEECCVQSYISPLVHSVHYKGRLTKILILILEGILKKISYVRRDYESVDEKILS